MVFYACKFYSLLQDVSANNDKKYIETTGIARMFENDVTLTLRHRASCIQDRRFATLQRTLFII